MLATKKDLKALEDRVDGLKNRIFKKEKPLTYSDYMSTYLFTGFASGLNSKPKPLEEDLFDNLEMIEKRQELLMKHLGLKFVEVEAIGKHEEIRKIKEVTSEPSSRKKTCKKCGGERPITDYHKNKNNKSGRRNVCKFCISEYMKAYALKHESVK